MHTPAAKAARIQPFTTYAGSAFAHTAPLHVNATPAAAKPPPLPLTEADLARLEHLLGTLPEALQPLDLSALDGYLCGVLLQPRRVNVVQWWPMVLDVEGRPAPDTPAVRELQHLVLRRHSELDHAIGERQWFDPWILAAEDDADADDEDAEDDNDSDSDDPGDNPAEALLPWIAGFAAAMEHFPQLMDMKDAELVEPMALLFMHFDPADLEDADELLAMIETLEPPADLAEAVQDIVRALMLVADVTRPRRVVQPARPVPRRPRSGTPARKSPRTTTRNAR